MEKIKTVEDAEEINLEKSVSNKWPLLFVKSSCFDLRESCYAKFIKGKTFPHCPIIFFNYFLKNKSGE